MRPVNLLLRIALTLLAAALAWGLMLRIFGWDGDPCQRAFLHPEDIPRVCLPLPQVP